MDVILLSRIAKLGQMGEIVSVKPGFARNYLLPKKLALRVSEANKKLYESQKQQLAAVAEQQRQDAEAAAKNLEGLVVNMLRQAADSGALFGSVTKRDVQKTLAEQGFSLNVEQIELTKPIKLVGIYEVAVRLHPDVARTVTLVVASSVEQAQALRNPPAAKTKAAAGDAAAVVAQSPAEVEADNPEQAA
ncbi:MAG: 50S ribosomal protein L9 [Alphaproteobacteria bacterium]|nr:50S ribosomal protein L9 [Alphaproteobacteria bacterium]